MPTTRTKSLAAVKEELLRLCHSFMYLTFSGHLISLVAFVMNVRYRFTYMEGEFERRCWLGFYNGRLWGFFTNPNAASNFAVLNLMMMVICLTILGRGITQGRKRFYAANFLVQSLIFFLSNSRSSWLCVYFFLLIAPFLGLMYWKDHPIQGKSLPWKTMVKRVAAVAAAAIPAVHRRGYHSQGPAASFHHPDQLFQSAAGSASRQRYARCR